MNSKKVDENTVKQETGIKSLDRTNDLDNYKLTLTKAADECSTDIIVNKGTPYSVCLIAKIIEKANKKIRMLCIGDCIEYLCYEEILNSIKLARNKGIEFIILLNRKLKNNELERLYCEMVKIIPENVFNENLKDDPFKTFITGDDFTYRFEFEANGIKGIGCFNDKGVTQNFINKFDQIQEEC